MVASATIARNRSYFSRCCDLSKAALHFVTNRIWIGKRRQIDWLTVAKPSCKFREIFDQVGQTAKKAIMWRLFTPNWSCR
jgi:hypothetical protein